MTKTAARASQPPRPGRLEDLSLQLVPLMNDGPQALIQQQHDRARGIVTVAS